MEIQHFSHEHTLTFCNVADGETDDEPPLCNGCSYHIRGPAYNCRTKFWLHKSCAELPLQIQDSRHTPHPLSLLPRPPFDPPVYICDGCGEMATGCFTYYCQWCQFYLDIKCVSLSEDHVPVNEVQFLKKKEIKTTTFHFSHRHQLTRCNSRKAIFDCKACMKPVMGMAYICVLCLFVLHESCFDLPREIQHPFHPRHPLRLQGLENEKGRRYCDACRKTFRDITYKCDLCDFDLDVSCAQMTARALKHKRHKHDLFYFMANDPGKFRADSFQCEVCYAICKGFCYRCMECDINVHLGCVPIPEFVKHKRHFHPLALMDRFVECDSGECYCDICETKRNPDHHVYCCEECNYVAHIDCVISEDEEVEILSYRIPKLVKSPEMLKGSNYEETAGSEEVDGEDEGNEVEKRRKEGESETTPSKGDSEYSFMDKHIKQMKKEQANELAKKASSSSKEDETIANIETMMRVKTGKLRALTQELEALRTRLDDLKEKRTSISSSKGARQSHN